MVTLFVTISLEVKFQNNVSEGGFSSEVGFSPRELYKCTRVIYR